MRVEDIHTYYGNSYILQGLSLAIAPGETVAVLGRNGVGKTTLVRSIIGFTPPVRGRIFLHDEIDLGSCTRADRAARRRACSAGTADLSQSDGRARRCRSRRVTDHETAPQPQWSLERVYDIFPRLRERRASALRDPVRRRTADAGDRTRARMQSPAADAGRADRGLSPLMVQELQPFCGQSRSVGVTLLIVEHRVSFALALADRIYLMSKGRVAQETSPQELRSDTDLRLRYLGV